MNALIAHSKPKVSELETYNNIHRFDLICVNMLLCAYLESSSAIDDKNI